MTASCNSIPVAIIGGGPAGLIAAQQLSAAGYQVELFDGMPSVGRKLLQAGKGGFNLTHSEPIEPFTERYGAQAPFFAPLLRQFGADQLRDWAKTLGFETFVGSSGRVFPLDMKAAPLVRAWLHQLREAGVIFHVRHYWTGWDNDGALHFTTPDGPRSVQAGCTLLALGGGSWPRLGSDGKWAPYLEQQGVLISALKPANCGIMIPWSDHFRDKFAGTPIKGTAISHQDIHGNPITRRGECVVTAQGLEGSLIYPTIPVLRNDLERLGVTHLSMDLLPDRSIERVTRELTESRGSKSLSNHLRNKLGLDGVKIALLYEFIDKETLRQPAALALAIKALPIVVNGLRPLEEAISSAGGIVMSELDEGLMLKQHPGVFCAGEMLDWEAPTGGDLLTGCFSTGMQAAKGMMSWIESNKISE